MDDIKSHLKRIKNILTPKVFKVEKSTTRENTINIIEVKTEQDSKLGPKLKVNKTKSNYGVVKIDIENKYIIEF
jgi:hypothetical protein